MHTPTLNETPLPSFFGVPFLTWDSYGTPGVKNRDGSTSHHLKICYNASMTTLPSRTEVAWTFTLSKWQMAKFEEWRKSLVRSGTFDPRTEQFTFKFIPNGIADAVYVMDNTSGEELDLTDHSVW